jgi:GAF domain-containing protein
MQQDRLVAELNAVIEQLNGTEKQKDFDPIGRVAEQVAKSFGAQPDEVAILVLGSGRKFLSFRFPEKLRTIGTIPLTSITALAARTAREKKPEIVNNFATVPHATVFEGVPMGRGEGELIHKIMSAPLSANGKVLGVIQVSRKGRNPSHAGPDFTAQDLRALVAMSSVVGEFLSQLPAPSK